MSIIKCSECGNSISNKAEKCPKCGCPADVSVKNIRKIHIKNILILVTIVFVIFIICFIIWKFFINQDVYWKNVEWGMSVEQIKEKNNGGSKSDKLREDTEESFSKKYSEYNNLKGTSTHFNYKFEDKKLTEVSCWIFNDKNILTDEEIIKKLQKYLKPFYGKANIEQIGEKIKIQKIYWETKDKNIEIINLMDGVIILNYQPV